MRRDVTPRRDEIIALLFKNEILSAAKLSENLAVSVQTIRADLRDVDEAGLVQRRNGTVRLRQQNETIIYLPREGISRQEKQRIALAVKNLSPDGARVALGTGKTLEICARFLASRMNLFVVFNSNHAVCALQNAFVESFNGRLRDECLNEHIFGNLAEARRIIDNGRIDYSTQPPHTSLGGLSPAVYANLNRAVRPASLEPPKGSAQPALTAT